jgi:hypothetical protein
MLRLGKRTLAGQWFVPSPTPRGASVIGGVASCGGGRAQAAFGRPNTGFQPTLRRTRLIQSTGSTRLAPLKPTVGRLVIAQAQNNRGVQSLHRYQ